MSSEPTVRLLKLSSGETIITKIKITDDENYVTLINPVKVTKWMEQSRTGQGAYENATFGPFESLSDGNVFFLRKTDIVLLTLPREDVILYYERLVKSFEVNKPPPLGTAKQEEKEEMQTVEEFADRLNRLGEMLGLDSDEEQELEEVTRTVLKGNRTLH